MILPFCWVVTPAFEYAKFPLTLITLATLAQTVTTPGESATTSGVMKKVARRSTHIPITKRTTRRRILLTTFPPPATYLVGKKGRFLVMKEGELKPEKRVKNFVNLVM